MRSAFPQIVHHGAADGVTGSCHRYMASEDFHLLVDCGLFQGQEAYRGGSESQSIDFDLDCVAAIIVTHVHIDHIGRLPYLLAAGFKGPILCSLPSARLLPLVIEDALKMGFTRDSKTIGRFLEVVEQRLMPLAYQTWYPLRTSDLRELKVRLQPAGHILGSAYVELDLRWRQSGAEAWQSHRTVFSGDLGAPHAPLLPAPKPPAKAHTLVIESTYGNRVHEDRATRRLRLKALVERALLDGGTVLIPAFSIGRTQELLYEFEGILHDMKVKPAGNDACRNVRESESSSTLRGQTQSRSAGACAQAGDEVWQDITIVVDSPLAAKFTKVYRELKAFWDEEATQRVRSGRHPLDFESLLTVDSHEDHLQLVAYLAETRRPAIVIAASGMAAGGRIVNYLKAMLGDPRHNVLFVGYQVPGTPGHEIMKAVSPHDASALAASPAGNQNAEGNSELNRLHGKRRQEGRSSPGLTVELDGEQFEIRAGVDYVGGYSAHADQENLLAFVRNMRAWPTQIRIVHGNEEARRGLKAALEQLAAEAGRTFEIILPTRT